MQVKLMAGLLMASASLAAAAPEFAGTAVQPGNAVRALVPLSAQQRAYAAEGGNAVPPQAVAVLVVPRNFDPARTWPVLLPLSTSDFGRKNRDDLRDFYQQAALAEGWIVLAGDGEQNPGHYTAGWRAGMTLAALDALHRSFPGSHKWPVAVAGFSGGAKRAANLAPLFALAGNRVIGLFLTGVNEDRLSASYRQFRPGAGFLQTPIYLSAGQADRVARLAEQQQVKRALEQAGFTRVRLETMPQGHAVSRSAVREALRWIRELAGLR